jgi:hypothetical protein
LVEKEDVLWSYVYHRQFVTENHDAISSKNLWRE